MAISRHEQALTLLHATPTGDARRWLRWLIGTWQPANRHRQAAKGMAQVREVLDLLDPGRPTNSHPA